MKINSLILIAFVALMSCNNSLNYYRIEGGALGTSYSITYSDRTDRKLQPEIQELLNNFEESLSVYRPNSIISKVNRNEDVELDDYFIEVFNKSKEIYEKTEGAFDISASPLFSIWGWGAEDKIEVTQELIDSLMLFVGMDKVSLENNKIIKQNPNLTLNANAIAKGYSSDVVARYLDSKGIKNYLVEIGGEMVLKGISSKAKAWKISIDSPIDGNYIPGNNVKAIIDLTDGALATSGNYRRYYVENGEKFSHTIDPRTGYSAKQNILSATVIAPDCITADAYATAFMTMGFSKSLELLKSLPELKVFFVYNDGEGVKTFSSETLTDITYIND